jgi:GDPmannose 4,6-dehydratase
MAFEAAGIALDWHGEAENETATRTDTGETVIRIDPAYYRPTEVELLLGDPEKARRELGWTATTTLEEMTAEMVEADLAEARLATGPAAAVGGAS